MSRSEELIAAFLDDTITPTELDELQTWLRSNPEGLRTFVEANVREQQLWATVQVREKLRLVEEFSSPQPTDSLHVLARTTTLVDDSADAANSLHFNGEKNRRTLIRKQSLTGLLVLGVVTCVLLIGLWVSGPSDRPDETAGVNNPLSAEGDHITESLGPSVLVTVTASQHAQWADGSEVKTGTRLASNTWHWQSGLIELATGSGTVLVIEAPVSLEMTDELHARLLSGNVVVRVPDGQSGFVVETPQMRVVDLGTEFGVSVSPMGETELQVFEGKVEAEITGLTTRKQVAAGETLRAAASGELRATDFKETRFIRRLFPREPDAQYGGLLYSQSSIDAVHVAWTESRPRIDADLSEWNPELAFHTACLPPFAETYFLEGMMMYDADHLYVAAYVGDPEPMRNSAPVGFEFAGGSVIVRISTDRKLGWPLPGTMIDPGTFNPPKKPFSPEVTSEQIVSIIMWYDAASSSPQIKLQYGLDMHREVRDPPGWQGTVLDDDDGRGYRLEYAIPWQLLNCAAEPPQGGEVFPALWMAHWSDNDGRIARGQLVEVTNHESQGTFDLPQSVFFHHGPSWGKALYLR